VVGRDGRGVLGADVVGRGESGDWVFLGGELGVCGGDGEWGVVGSDVIDAGESGGVGWFLSGVGSSEMEGVPGGVG
jgi:hypothetical protein